jgi:Caspase domain
MQVFFYFSGHGTLSHADSQVLLGNDGRPMHFHNEFHAHVTCHPNLQRASVVAVLDCCRNTPDDGPRRTDEAPPAGLPAAVRHRPTVRTSAPYAPVLTAPRIGLTILLLSLFNPSGGEGGTTLIVHARAFCVHPSQKRTNDIVPITQCMRWCALGTLAHAEQVGRVFLHLRRRPRRRRAESARRRTDKAIDSERCHRPLASHHFQAAQRHHTQCVESWRSREPVLEVRATLSLLHWAQACVCCGRGGSLLNCFPLHMRPIDSSHTESASIPHS